jgi:hypothetical protein
MVLDDIINMAHLSTTIIVPSFNSIFNLAIQSFKDSQSLSLEEKKNSYLNSQATNVLFDVVSNAAIYVIMPFYNACEFWTNIQEKYDVSNTIEDDCIPSTSGRNELSSTSPTCDKTQGNDMVSGDEYCNIYSELSFDYCSSHCNASPLDLNTFSTTNALHACLC